MPTQMWRPIAGHGLERCELEPTERGFRITGTTLLSIDDKPYEIRYSVLTDPGWLVSTVGAHVQGPENDRRLALAADGEGSWSVTDEPVLDLFGALDLDLSWTPSGHTVAINRLSLDIGDAADSTAVVISFPGDEIQRKTRRYERLAMRRYRLTSGDFETDLEVDGNGLVVTYPGRWTSALGR